MTAKRFINDIDNEKLIDTKGALSTIYYSDSVDFYELGEFLNKINDENEQLRHDATILIQSNQDYRKENGELKQRNDRQAKQLDRLYNLIEQKDWRTLNDILDDFKRCEEQLQRE